MKLYYDADDPPDGTPNWTEVTNIITFPVPQIRLDEPSKIIVELRDFEGALYSIWEGRDFVDMKVTDGAGAPTTLFRGFISKKKFKHKKTTLIISGFSKKLESNPFNKNYILAHGQVESVPGIGAYIAISRPDGDDDVDDWWVAAGAHYDDINDDLLYDEDDPPSTGGYVMAKDDDDGTYEAFTMDNTNLDGLVTSVEKIIVRYAARDVGQDLGEWEIDINVTNGGAWEAAVAYDIPYPDANCHWYSATFDGLTGVNQADIDALKVRFKAAAAIPADKGHLMTVMYCEVYYTGTQPNALGLETDDEEPIPFEWADDYWINDQDVGILIVDNTNDVTAENWTCSAITQTDGTEIEGDENSLDVKNDGLSYYVTDTNPIDGTIDPIMDADNGGIDSTLYKLNKIVIKYRIGVKNSGGSLNGAILEIWDGSEWDMLEVIFPIMSDFWYWIERDRTIYGTDAVLQDYLTKIGDNYTSLTDIRIRLAGSGAIYTVYVKVDYLTVDICYYTHEISPIMEQIDGNGASWIKVDGMVWAESGVVAGDGFKIGENTTKILTDMSIHSGVPINLKSTLTKYIAQWFRGTYSIEILKKICLLEGLHWWEDHQADPPEVVVSKEADFVDSTVDLTQANYLWEWEFESTCNQYKAVEVFGCAAYRIYYEAIDPDDANTSPLTKSIIEETILTQAEAKEVGDEQLLEYKVKRPSIRIPLDGVNANLGVGKTVTLTMVRPTVAEDDYPIRMIERHKIGISGIKTIIYCGLGKSTWEENLADVINKAMYLAHKAHTDRLVSTPLGAGAALSWGDIGGADAGAVAAIEADDTIYTKAEVDAFLAFGVANKRWIELPLEWMSVSTNASVGSRRTYYNLGANDFNMYFAVPIPLIIGSKNLVITRVKVGLRDADVGDCINEFYVLGWTDHDSDVQIISDLANKNTIAEHIYDFVDTTIGGVYESISIRFLITATNAGDFEKSYCKLEYYYA